MPASAVVASRKHDEVPHSDRPSTHPTSGELKVTDSGCSVTEVNPVVDDVGDGTGLNEGVAELVTTGLVAAGGVVAGWLLHPASRKSARAPTTRVEGDMLRERSRNGLCSGLR
jgi:hypothetical protein